MDTAQIALHNLSKQYPGVDSFALRNLSLSVKPGEVYGVLGPNGAGKSTTIRILMGFLQKTSGSATILGLDTTRDSVAIKRSIGYLSGDMALYPAMTGQQYLEYMSDLLPPATKAYRDSLVKRLACNTTQKTQSLSRGNRQKLGIVQAFMSKPKVLILDEPSSGLDPLMQEVFYDLIDEAKQRGASVFMSSHILGEVQKVCDRIGVIKEGQLVAERTIAELRSQAAQTFDITFADKLPLSELSRIKGVKIIEHDTVHVTLHFHGSLPQLLSTLSRYDVQKLDTRSLDIEELFMHFYSGKKEQA